MDLRRRYVARSGSYCIEGFKQEAALIVYKMREVCKNSILALGILFCRFVGLFGLKILVCM